MVTVGEHAPEFAAPIAGGRSYDDVEEFVLADAVGDGPLVLAFYPAAFTGGCTEEMCAFRDSMAAFDDLDARVYGVSVDLPYAQNVWIREHDLGFPMLSDWDHELIRLYDVVAEDPHGIEWAERAVFVIDADGRIDYAWVRDGENPDFEALVADVRAAARRASGES